MSEIKMFNRWSTEGIEVKDPGIKDYISLKPVVVPRISHGRHASKQFYKSEVNIVERLMNHLFVPGHRGKRHRISSAKCSGHSEAVYNIVKECFEIIEKKLKKNPIEVFVKAVENAALREEVSSYRVGSIITRKAVITSPQRRVDLALRYMVQGAYRKVMKGNKGMADYLAEEIINAYNNSKDSFAISEKERLEREAEGAR
ncbi:MAG: 30S ribosomal protein S7 [Candidatus Aenigmatarchaeota archaeon]|nr:MAG: 30S ribosomal protein S7 [Candidatus Aenigmarchaeota archaeon]